MTKHLWTALTGIILLAGAALAAPPVVGNWEGKIDTGAGSLRVVVHISGADNGKLTATLDSPDQGAAGIPISAVTVTESAFHLEADSIGASYDGKINKDNSEIVGEWKQGGGSVALTFKRGK